MTSKKILRIRRAIVFALFDYANPQDIDSVCSHDKILIENADIAILRQEWKNLQDAGFLIAIAGYGGAYCKLNESLKKELEAGSALRNHEFLYGIEAVK